MASGPSAGGTASLQARSRHGGPGIAVGPLRFAPVLSGAQADLLIARMNGWQPRPAATRSRRGHFQGALDVELAASGDSH